METKIKQVVEEYKTLKNKAEEMSFLTSLENLYNAVFLHTNEERKVITEEEFKNAIEPLSIEKFFSIYNKVAGFSIAKFSSEEKYGIMRDLLKQEIENVKTLLNCKELDDPEGLAEKLSFEIEERFKAIKSVIDDFYNKNEELTKIGLLSRVGEILEDKISEYF